MFEAMEFSFLSSFSSVTLAIIMFIVMLATYHVGYRVSTRFQTYFVNGLGPIEGSLLGLLALLLAFTFSMAVSRYDTRRRVLLEEVNYIGTALLRADLYEPVERAGFRADFKEYIDVRSAFLDTGFDEERVAENLNQTAAVSKRIWDRAARLGRDPANLIASNQMIPALNNMIDVVTSRTVKRQATVPDAIIWVLFGLCALSSFTIGVDRRESKASMMVVNAVFALMISACIFLIIDLDRPRSGLITLEGMNGLFADLRNSFDRP